MTDDPSPKPADENPTKPRDEEVVPAAEEDSPIRPAEAADEASNASGDDDRPTGSGTAAEEFESADDRQADAALRSTGAAPLSARIRGGGRGPSTPETSTPGRPSRRPPAHGGERRGAAASQVTDDPRADGPVPIPSKRRSGTDEDLDHEVEAALAGMSLDDILSGETSAGAGTPLELDERYRATVVRIHRDNVFFSLTGRNEGVASVRQFDEPPEVGAALDVIVRKFHREDGLYEVSVPGASIHVSDWSDLEEGAVVEATVTGSNTGGLECTVNKLRGFIPASQVSIYHVENLDEYVGQKLTCVVTEANPQRRNLVLSHRALLERQREEQRQQLLSELEVGQQREGVVTSLRDFGAFVDLGGLDGLIHISQLSWDRVNHPSEVLKEGQRVKVRIDKFDPQTGKLSLVYRDSADHPWFGIEQRFTAGAIVKGTVTRIAKFGAFVRIAPGVEGLAHISELAHHRVANVSNVVQEGQEVDVKILSIDPTEQRISLSIKAAAGKPETQPSADESPEEDEPPRESAVRRQHAGPLKGGVDRSSGGDHFGLKW